MKKFIIIAAIALVCALSVAPRASAQSGMFIFSGVPSGPINPGDSFTVSVSLQITTGGTVGDLSGLSYWFAQSNPTSGFAFQITNRNITGSMFTDLQSGLVYPQVMDPINRNPNGTQTGTDLGALITNGTAGQPNGTYFIANLTFQAMPGAAPGVYTLSSTSRSTPGVGGRYSVFNDSQGDTADITASTFNVTIIPEPSTYALLVFAGLGMILVAHRRRASAV